MKKIILLLIFFIFSFILPVKADVIPMSSTSIKYYGIGVINMPMNYNVYEKPDKNSEIIKEVKNSFAGVVMTDGKGNTVIETISGTCDTRELTSTGADATRIKRYEYENFDDYTLGEPRIIKEIRDMCQYFNGYYEFAYGNIRGENNVYFTFYSSNEEYINIFKGGKRKWKSIMK